jgi:hypothetical protein
MNVSEAVGNIRVYSLALHTSEHRNRSLEMPPLYRNYWFKILFLLLSYTTFHLVCTCSESELPCLYYVIKLKAPELPWMLKMPVDRK